eukprot:3127099-Prymnesium_polylepis.1
MAHGTWRMMHDAWRMAHGPWPMAHGPWPMAHGPWPMAHAGISSRSDRCDPRLEARGGGGVARESSLATRDG